MTLASGTRAHRGLAERAGRWVARLAVSWFALTPLDMLPIVIVILQSVNRVYGSFTGRNSQELNEQKRSLSDGLEALEQGLQTVGYLPASHRSTKSSRSLPQNISSPTKHIGTPNTPRAIARSVTAASRARASSEFAASIKRAPSIPTLRCERAQHPDVANVVVAFPIHAHHRLHEVTHYRRGVIFASLSRETRQSSTSRARPRRS